MELDIQQQYDLIHSYFKTTTDSYDELDWDGETLLVILDDVVIEIYTYSDLNLMIENF